jgi:hypothetical protein
MIHRRLYLYLVGTDQALASLPPMAGYRLTPAEQGAIDGH